MDSRNQGDELVLTPPTQTPSAAALPCLLSPNITPTWPVSPAQGPWPLFPAAMPSTPAVSSQSQLTTLAQGFVLCSSMPDCPTKLL